MGIKRVNADWNVVFFLENSVAFDVVCVAMCVNDEFDFQLGFLYVIKDWLSFGRKVKPRVNYDGFFCFWATCHVTVG